MKNKGKGVMYMQSKENKRKEKYQEPYMEIWKLDNMPYTIVEVSSQIGGGSDVDVNGRQRSF